MLRTAALATFGALFVLPLASCPTNTVGPTDAAGLPADASAPDASLPDASAPDASLPDARSSFEATYTAFVARMGQDDMLNRSDGSYASLPEFQAIVGQGKASLPFVFEKIAAGDVRLNRAAALVTGVKIFAAIRADPQKKSWGPGHPPFGAQDTAKLWLEWWAAHKDDPEWKP